MISIATNNFLPSMMERISILNSALSQGCAEIPSSLPARPEFGLALPACLPSKSVIGGVVVHGAGGSGEPCNDLQDSGGENETGVLLLCSCASRRIFSRLHRRNSTHTSRCRKDSRADKTQSGLAWPGQSSAMPEARARVDVNHLSGGARTWLGFCPYRIGFTDLEE